MLYSMPACSGRGVGWFARAFRGQPGVVKCGVHWFNPRGSLLSCLCIYLTCHTGGGFSPPLLVSHLHVLASLFDLGVTYRASASDRCAEPASEGRVLVSVFRGFRVGLFRGALNRASDACWAAWIACLSSSIELSFEATGSAKSSGRSSARASAATTD